MKGTKLWQAPGSPIIQGRSRNKRPFLNVWGYAFVMGSGALAATVTVVCVFPGPAASTLVDALGIAATVVLAAIPGLLVGSALGVAVARLLGTRRVRTAGMLTGVLLGVVNIMLLVPDLTLRGVTIT